MSKQSKNFAIEKEIFLKYIKAKGLRRTPQRDLILEIFLSTEEHLTSEALYRLVKRKDPSVGLTTIYRTLRLFIDAGLAREVRFGDTATYYEHHYDHQHHDHMICTECGRVLEFFSPDIEAMQDQIAEDFSFRPTHHSLRLWGLCSRCQKSSRNATTAPSGAQPRVRVKTSI